jgi:hypothetical protein
MHTWESLPQTHRDAIEANAGEEIVRTELVAQDLMPGLTAVVHTMHGRLFVKAAPDASPAGRARRREMDACAALPYGLPAPRMRHSLTAEGWTVLAFDCLPQARPADLAPGSPDLPGALKAIRAISATPVRGITRTAGHNMTRLQETASVMLERHLMPGRQREMYQAGLSGFAVADLAGDRLAHCRLASHLLVAGSATYATGWSEACRGAPGLDAALLAPGLIEAGHEPGAAEELVAGLPGWAGLPPAAVNGVAALQAMFRHHRTLNGPGGPREDRARTFGAALKWLEYRLERYPQPREATPAGTA